MFDLSVDEKNKVAEAYQDLVDSIPSDTSKENMTLIWKAYNFALKAHGSERRKSGEPYILHPIAVAKIVAEEIGMGTKSIVAALLHDVVEDTEYNLSDIDEEFGSTIKVIIDGLTKITGAFGADSSLQVSTFRKLLLTLAEDVRVILIKLADRLHNMRTLSALPRKKQIKTSGETLYLYAPLAHRLGLYAIKTELENLSLKYKEPEVFQDLLNRISHTEKISSHFINKFIEPIKQKLDGENFSYSVNGRPKSIYSVFRKMQSKEVPFEQIFDILAVRIIFAPKPNIPEKTQCWYIYSLITDIYKVKPDRIRDWVSHPKANGYEALHMTVMGPHGKWIEVQIRSDRMNEIAEKGFAAHWKYKSGETVESELDRWIKKVSDMLYSQEVSDLEFLEDFKLNLFESEIITFTPKGKEVILPLNATALDFAYDIHTEVGHKAIGAKVNHRLVPLSHELSTGDQVEILTSDIQSPQYEWLDIVITARAKSAIKSVFKDQRKKDITKGQKILEDKLKELNYRPNANVFRKLFDSFEVQSKEELYLKLGREVLTLENLKRILKKRSKKKRVRIWGLEMFNRKTDDEDTIEEGTAGPFMLHEDQENPNYRLAKCCAPIPGDEVIGYVNRDVNEDIIIHKTNCPEAQRLLSSQAENIIQANWTSHKVIAYLARIRATGVDRLGMTNEITTIISKQLNVNMRSVHIETRDGFFEGEFDLYVHNTEDLNNLLLSLSKLKGIDQVKRVEKT